MFIYPSDISREQFKKIQYILERARKKTRPKTLYLYDVFCDVLYVKKTDGSGKCCRKKYPK